ncbi:NfeD family protein [Chloroflexota bacterium]
MNYITRVSVSAIELSCYNECETMMTGRLIIAIISTIMEEAAIAVGVLWGLPKLGVRLPLWGLILIMIPIMIAWVSYSIFTFRKGTIALKTAQLVGMHNMVGTEGVVISSLTPEGLVRIKGELWIAKSSGDELEPGTEVIVTGQERLKLKVREISPDSS